MSVFVYNRFVALLALFALSAGLAFAVPPIRRRLAAAGFADLAPWLAGLVALVATAGSLAYSEVFGFEPCRLCWYQRIAMYPLVVILAVGAWRRDEGLHFYALPLSIVGGLVSAYHYLIQTFPSADAGACTTGVPCTAKYVNEFGFVSIPFMAFAGFLFVSVTLIAFRRPSRGSS